MRKDKSPQYLAKDMSERSTCAVQVGAVIVDSKGRIFSWGWNNMGSNGLGQHAEYHAITRCNHKRLKGSTIYVYGIRKRNQRVVLAKPCPKCMSLILDAGIATIVYCDKDGDWVRLEIE